MRGSGRNLARFTMNAEDETWGLVSITPPENKYAGARPCASFHPSVDSKRKPMRRSRLGRSRIASCTKAAPSIDRQPSAVGVGTTVKVEMVPSRKLVRLLKDA